MRKVVSASLISIVLLMLAACGGEVQKINIDIHIPELDTAKYSDSAYIEGWKSLKAGNPAQAIKLFQQSNSIDEKLFVGFGYAFLAQGKISLAKRNFEKAVAVDTDNLPAQLGLATMHEQMNEVESAYDIYSRLRSLYPEHAWVKVRYENIKSTETQKYLEQAQQFKTDNKRPEYIEALEKAAAYSPEIIEIEIEIADFFYAGEDYKKAATHYERILEKLPNKEDILVKLAEVYEKSGQYDLAVVMYKRLLELKPGDIVFLNKVNDLKFKFYELNLPEKFKNIFFKQDISREELAALIGYYFAKHLETRPPVIITDITASFAREYIIKVCTLGIMKIRPDHSFDRFPIINRTAYVAVIDALLRYLRVDRSSEIRLPPLETVIEPADVSPLHKNYKIIKYLINSQLVKLDPDNKFNPTIDVKPAEVLVALKKILTGLEKK